MGEITRKHKTLLGALLVIICILLIPVSVPITSIEENPDDAASYILSKDHPISFHLDFIPPGTSAIAFWTGNSEIHLPAQIEVTFPGEEQKTISLERSLVEERKIIIPLPRTSSLDLELTAPPIPDTKPLMLRTAQGAKDTLAYTLYEHKPLLFALVERLYDHDATADDIEYVWKEGAAIAEGNNPYERAVKSQYRDGKYATYFPLSYLTSALIQKAGFASFESWLTVVRPLVLFFQIGTALLVLFYSYKKNALLLGIVGFFLILFHRFTLYPARVHQIDFPALFFLILGIMLLIRKPKTGYLVIGISLAIKHISIILLPVFLIWEYTQHKSKKGVAVSLILLLAVPTLTILPFFIQSPLGVFYSLSFSSSRSSGGDFSSPDLAALLSVNGNFPKFFMYGLILFVILAFRKKEIELFGACLIILTIFIGFNQVLFFQYLAWIIPFIPLALLEKKRD